MQLHLLKGMLIKLSNYKSTSGSKYAIDNQFRKRISFSSGIENFSTDSGVTNSFYLFFLKFKVSAFLERNNRSFSVSLPLLALFQLCW